MEKIQILVDQANVNLDEETQLSLDGLVSNPKETSFKLMKLDLEQSCRALCSIERVETTSDQSLAIIPFSTDAVEVQKLISRKALIPSDANAPKGVTKKDYMNLQQSSEAIQLAQQQ